MELQLGLVSDAANVDATGKLYILGEFRYLFATSVPTFHPSMALVLRLVAPTVEVKSQKAKLRLQFVDGDGHDILPANPPAVDIVFGPIGPADRGVSNSQVVLNMGNLPIPRYGDYVIHVWVDERRIGEVRFHVAPPPSQAAPAAPPSPAAG
jgi:hypothetical protein